MAGEGNAGAGGEPDLSLPSILATVPEDGENGALKNVRWNDAGNVPHHRPERRLDYRQAQDLGFEPLDYELDIGPTVETTDFDQPPLAALGVFSTAGAMGWRSADVTDAIKDDLETLARGDSTQFRLRFTIATNDDDSTDLAQFNSSATKPELEVKALLP